MRNEILKPQLPMRREAMAVLSLEPGKELAYPPPGSVMLSGGFFVR